MLLAIGGAANVDDIGLETTRVEVDQGVVKVDRRMHQPSRGSTPPATSSAACSWRTSPRPRASSK